MRAWAMIIFINLRGRNGGSWMASFRLQLEKTNTGRARMVRPGWLTGLVGREEMMLFIDSRRSGYISARRTSRSRH